MKKKRFLVISGLAAVGAYVAWHRHGGMPSRDSAFERKDVIMLTPLAASKVREMSKDFDLDKTVYLRVGVSPAQAPHFKYSMDITESVDPTTDFLGLSQGFRVVVDAKSAPFLAGTAIDYRSTDSGSGFWFDNPNAETSGSDDGRAQEAQGSTP